MTHGFAFIRISSWRAQLDPDKTARRRPFAPSPLQRLHHSYERLRPSSLASVLRFLWGRHLNGSLRIETTGSRSSVEKPGPPWRWSRATKSLGMRDYPGQNPGVCCGFWEAPRPDGDQDFCPAGCVGGDSSKALQTRFSRGQNRPQPPRESPNGGKPPGHDPGPRLNRHRAGGAAQSPAVQQAPPHARCARPKVLGCGTSLGGTKRDGCGTKEVVAVVLAWRRRVPARRRGASPGSARYATSLPPGSTVRPRPAPA